MQGQEPTLRLPRAPLGSLEPVCKYWTRVKVIDSDEYFVLCDEELITALKGLIVQASDKSSSELIKTVKVIKYNPGI